MDVFFGGDDEMAEGWGWVDWLVGWLVGWLGLAKLSWWLVTKGELCKELISPRFRCFLSRSWK